MLNTEVVFEISVTNVDKPPLAEAEVRHRLRQFEGWGTVVLTRAPRFYQKAAVFPDCTFIVGWDTAARLVHPRYYGGREGAIREALDTMRDAGCRFLVAGREEGGAFRTLSDVPIPGDYSNMFEAIPESRFRADVSSTELRKAHQ